MGGGEVAGAAAWARWTQAGAGATPTLAPAAAGLAHLGDDLEDLVNLLLKVHVKQAVRLIQHLGGSAAQRRAGQGGRD